MPAIVARVGAAAATGSSIDRASGALIVGGAAVFPIGLSNPPPPNSTTPDGRNGLAEVAANGVNFVRTGLADWTLELVDSQIAAQEQLHAAARAHGLGCWLWLGETANLPARPEAHRRHLSQRRGAARLQGNRRAAQPVARRERCPAGGNGAGVSTAEIA
jgi:hypothetical protein